MFPKTYRQVEFSSIYNRVKIEKKVWVERRKRWKR
jgi:hypothetical protein